MNNKCVVAVHPTRIQKWTRATAAGPGQRIDGDGSRRDSASPWKQHLADFDVNLCMAAFVVSGQNADLDYYRVVKFQKND